MDKTDLDNPLYEGLFKIIEATTNIPLSRVHNKINNIRDAMEAEREMWERVALLLGWSRWNIGLGERQEMLDIEDEIATIKKQEKEKRRIEKKYPGKTEAEIVLLEKGKEIYNLNKGEQVKTLLDLGLDQDDINELKKEENRVDKILELYKDDPTTVDSLLQVNKGYEPEIIKDEKTIKKDKKQINRELEKKFLKQQKKERENEEKNITCAAVNKRSERCGLKVVGRGSYCTIHQKVDKRTDNKKVQCKRFKTDGKRCKMQTNNASGLCYYHD